MVYKILQLKYKTYGLQDININTTQNVIKMKENYYKALINRDEKKIGKIIKDKKIIKQNLIKTQKKLHNVENKLTDTEKELTNTKNTLQTNIETVSGNVNTLQGTVGDTSNGLVKDVNTLKSNIGEVNISDLSNNINTLQTDVGNKTAGSETGIFSSIKEINNKGK